MPFIITDLELLILCVALKYFFLILKNFFLTKSFLKLSFKQIVFRYFPNVDTEVEISKPD